MDVTTDKSLLRERKPERARTYQPKFLAGNTAVGVPEETLHGKILWPYFFIEQEVRPFLFQSSHNASDAPEAVALKGKHEKFPRIEAIVPDTIAAIFVLRHQYQPKPPQQHDRQTESDCERHHGERLSGIDHEAKENNRYENQNPQTSDFPRAHTRVVCQHNTAYYCKLRLKQFARKQNLFRPEGERARSGQSYFAAQRQTERRA